MRSGSLKKILVVGLTVVCVSGLLAIAQTEEQPPPEKKPATQPKHKKTATKPGATQTQPQTQTAPATQPAHSKSNRKTAVTPHTTQATPAAEVQPGQAAKGKPAAPMGKGAAKKDPAQAGWSTIYGRIVSVHPDQHMIVIQTDTKPYQVYMTDQTQISRDGQAAKLSDVKVNDRADSCHLNAKHLAQNLKVTSAEKALLTRPTPPPKQ